MLATQTHHAFFTEIFIILTLSNTHMIFSLYYVKIGGFRLLKELRAFYWIAIYLQEGNLSEAPNKQLLRYDDVQSVHATF